MPFEMIRADLTMLTVDAVVNAANSRLQRGGGVCGAIFAKADGARLQAACNEIGFCPTGSAVITPSFGLPAPYVIHAVGPVWQGGLQGEAELLRSAYMQSLNTAQQHALHSVAFPLISSGIYGFPKQKALSVAISAIGDWLLNADSDMQVYLVLFDSASFGAGSALHDRIRAYIDERYVAEHTFARRNSALELARSLASAPLEAEEAAADNFIDAAPLPASSAGMAPPKRSLKDVVAQSSESFSQMLFRLIDERGMADPEVYKRANMDRKLFSKIRSNPDYQPSKGTVLALCIALRLNLDQAADLLRRAGYALSPSSKSDLIIEYFISERLYNIHELNEALFAFDLKPLGA